MWPLKKVTIVHFERGIEILQRTYERIWTTLNVENFLKMAPLRKAPNLRKVFETRKKEMSKYMPG